MSRITIIREDGAVYVDGVAVKGLPAAAWQGMPSNIHALQFDASTNKGHLEFVPTETEHPPNQALTSLPAWAQTLVQARQQRLQQLATEAEDGTD